MGEVVEFPVPQELSESQRKHWEQQLEFAERAVEYAQRMLGKVATAPDEPPEAS